jgi:hypothetical protein
MRADSWLLLCMQLQAIILIGGESVNESCTHREQYIIVYTTDIVEFQGVGKCDAIV